MTESYGQELLAKIFVDKWQLNVAERAGLLNQPLQGNLIADEIARLAAEGGWYPRDWRPDQDFDGGLIEANPGGRVRVYWKGEVGVGQFTLLEVEEHDSLKEAASSFGKRFFKSSFDGIAIDWEERTPT